MGIRRQPHAPDMLFLALVGIIVLLGLVALTSASGVHAYQTFGVSMFYVKRQLLFGVLPGMALMSSALFIPYPFWKRCAVPIFLTALLLLILVLIPGIGVSYGRAQSWFLIAGFSFQPSEFAKLAFLLYCAAWIAERGSAVRSFLFGFFPFLLMLGVLVLLIALEPDVGTMTLIAALAFLVYFIAGAPWRHLLLLATLGLGALASMVVVAPYRIARITTFLSPESDLSGAGYQVTQALIALGSGGLFGRGIGASRQKFQYLPEVAGDSIIAIIGEEIGFVFLALFLSLFLALLFRGFAIARRVDDPFARYVVIGVMLWIGLQALFNVGSMIGLLPLTGLPLPLVSYGGTALTMLLCALGIVANISRYTAK